MDNAYDILQNAIESGKPLRRSIAVSTLRPEIVKATVITPDLVSRARIAQNNKFDPRVLFQSAVRNGDINAINSLIGGLSINMIFLRSLLIKVAIEEVGIANVGLVELVLKTASSERSTFEQLLFLSHALAKSNKSDFLKALWNVYGVPDNYQLVKNYGLTLTESGVVCDEAMKALKDSDPMVVYWMSQDEDLCYKFITDFIFNDVTWVDQDLTELIEDLYKREGNILYILYLVALTITHIESTQKPVLPVITKDQAIKMEAIRNRVVTRQPVIDVTSPENHRSDIPMSELGELILEISNQPGIKDVFK